MIWDRRRGHLERGKLLGQTGDARRIGALVHAVEAWDATLLEQLRDGLVGGDHQVLDQAVGLGLGACHGRADVAVLVEEELRLGGVDDQGPAALPRPRQRGGRAAGRRKRRTPRVRGVLAPGEDAVDALVIEALVGADERAVERRAPRLGPRQVELDGHRQPFRSRHERARLVGERCRQHRFDRVGHVHARRAAARLEVEGAALIHEGAHVGDVHPHPHLVGAERFGGYRVIEVACADRVDGERRQVAQVPAPRRAARPVDAAGGAPCLALDVARERAPEATVAHQLRDRGARALAIARRPHHARVG